MDVPGQGGQGADFFHMPLSQADGPVQVGNAPPLGDVESKQPRQLFGLRLCDGIAPGAERAELPPFPIKGQVAVHHGGDPHGPQAAQGLAVLGLHLLGHLGVSGLDALPGVL